MHKSTASILLLLLIGYACIYAEVDTTRPKQNLEFAKKFAGSWIFENTTRSAYQTEPQRIIRGQMTGRYDSAAEPFVLAGRTDRGHPFEWKMFLHPKTGELRCDMIRAGAVAETYTMKWDEETQTLTMNGVAVGTEIKLVRVITLVEGSKYKMLSFAIDSKGRKVVEVSGWGKRLPQP